MTWCCVEFELYGNGDAPHSAGNVARVSPREENKWSLSDATRRSHVVRSRYKRVEKTSHLNVLLFTGEKTGSGEVRAFMRHGAPIWNDLSRNADFAAV